MKNRDYILNKWMEGQFSRDSRVLNPRELRYRDIDDLVWQWYEKNNTSGKHITGKHIQQTALRLATELGYNRFSASRGWLTSWQKRHNISTKPSATRTGRTENTSYSKD